MRVLFANSYPMDAARAGVAAGTYPDHHLYGTRTLPPGWTVTDLEHRPGGRLTDLGQRIDRFGELDQQAQALRERGGDAVLYAGTHLVVRGLLLARRARALRMPVVAVVHGAPESALALQREMLRGADRLVSLCASTTRALVDLGVDPGRVDTLPWGPDPAFGPFLDAPAPDPAGPVLSSGKSNRDVPTLLEALRRTGRPGRVYVRDPAAAPPAPDGVQLVVSEPPPRPPGAPATYDHVLADLHRAALVCVPLRRPQPLHGITELNDALACGRPVVMTRAPFVDLDIEAEGVGVWVEEGDVDGLAAAIDGILGDPARLAAMSARAREVVAERWSSHAFAAGVHRALLAAA